MHVARTREFTWGMSLRKTIHRVASTLAMVVAFATISLSAAAQDAAAVASSSMTRQPLSEAWWTGPMLAPSAATLPPGHMLIEPYFYDVRGGGSNTFGSLSYILYGVTNRLTMGMIPIFDYEKPGSGLSSSMPELGDTGLLLQYGLTRFHEGSWRPMTALNVQETFPTGHYDQLGDRPSNGFGSGAYTTALALYSQTYFWLPNGRILRMRFNLSDAFSSSASVQGVSVYGTVAGFSGNAKPGNTAFADAAWEYSVTRNWVIALDVEYHFEGNTRVTGYNTLEQNIAQDSTSGSMGEIIFAPAFEYNWKPTIGVLFGTRIIEVGHNISPSVTPAIAINIVH
jgi:hypothetical protein